jgi:hypothetical protein
MDATLSDLELQQELERFTTQFADRVTQAAEGLERSPDQAVRDEALRKNLLYVSSAIEIATGTYPEINILDMVVFIHLSRAVLEKHWIPHLYGQDGASLADVFAVAEEDLTEVAAKALSPAQRKELLAIVDDWLTNNPAQVRVEGIRLSDFSAAAGSAGADRAGHARGLLASVKAAARTANQAVVLSDRYLFLVHRLPSIWRLQARLAAREIQADAVAQLSGGPNAPLVRAAREARRLARRGLLYVGLLGAGSFLVWRLGWAPHR